MIVIILKLVVNTVIHLNVFTRLVSYYIFILRQRLRLQILFGFEFLYLTVCSI